MNNITKQHKENLFETLFELTDPLNCIEVLWSIYSEIAHDYDLAEEIKAERLLMIEVFLNFYLKTEMLNKGVKTLEK